MLIHQERLEAYVRLVLRFRRALNLTSVSDSQLFMQRFIEPSRSLVDLLPSEGRILDIGSGMGIPGVPLAILKANVTVVMVERRKKRAEFLRHVVRELQLNAEVFDDDVNMLACLGVDACVARAVTRVHTLLDMCVRHVNDNAIAVFPVPMQSLPAQDKQWLFRDSVLVGAGSDAQHIQIYSWKGGCFT